MDLDTFITILRCFIADWRRGNDHRIPKQTTGPRSKISIAEVLSLCILSQMRGNVPWRSERSFVMHMLAHRKGMFRGMPKHSHLNKCRRELSDLLVPLQQDLAQVLSPHSSYEVADCTPIRHCSTAHALRYKRHWINAQKG